MNKNNENEKDIAAEQGFIKAAEELIRHQVSIGKWGTGYKSADYFGYQQRKLNYKYFREDIPGFIKAAEDAGIEFDVDSYKRRKNA